MRPLTTLVALSLFALLLGCGEPKADVSATKSHRSGSMAFSYPKNWKVAEDFDTPDVHTIFVETPGQAIVILQSYRTDSADELADYAEAFSVDASDGTSVGQMTAEKLVKMPQAKGYDWTSEDFSIDLLGESVPHQRLYGCKDIGGRRIFLIFQVATEDVANAQAGFELIRDSLKITDEEEQEVADQRPAVVESKPK
jgi:hypothetical protein